MMKPVIFGGLLLVLPFSSEAGTHCLPGETDYFSCEMAKNGKVVSVCGGDGWLQYRFGRLGNVELAYPSSREGSLGKFHATYFNKYGYFELSFLRGNTTYIVDLSEEHDDLKTGDRVRPSGSVSVEIGKRKYISMDCRYPVSRAYAFMFGDLISSLESGRIF